MKFPHLLLIAVMLLGVVAVWQRLFG